MYSPAVFLHKGQKLMASQDTLEILQALAAGNIVLVDEEKISKVEIPEQELQSEESKDTSQVTDNIFETIKPARRGIRK